MTNKKQLNKEQLKKVSGGTGGRIGPKKSTWGIFVDDVCTNYNYWLDYHSNEPRSVKRAKVSWYMDAGMDDYGDEGYQEIAYIKNNDPEYWEQIIDWITDLGFKL